MVVVSRRRCTGSLIALALYHQMPDILDMLNMSKTILRPEQRAFIDTMAELLDVWSMPGNSARAYAYLQIREVPVTIDEIARDLEISRTNAWNALKLLVEHGNARKQSERGTKRVLFVAAEDFGAPLRRQAQALGAMSRVIDQQRRSVADSGALERLERLARFHADLQSAMDEVIQPRVESDWRPDEAGRQPA